MMFYGCFSFFVFCVMFLTAERVNRNVLKFLDYVNRKDKGKAAFNIF